ncbi:MAG: hypothetical protein WDN67_00345 [Candidatus Moraniibacteriota bacterium]
MGRKKKEKNEPEASDPAFQLDHILGSDAKRSLLALFLATLALIVLLGFFDVAGPLGHGLDDAFGSIFGFGKWLLPIVLQ